LIVQPDGVDRSQRTVVSESEILNQLAQYGFRPAYRSAALTVLVNPELPGLEVRVGTTQVVFERDGREIYRASHGSFDMQQALAANAGERSRRS
jgi:hypothetical protein